MNLVKILDNFLSKVAPQWEKIHTIADSKVFDTQRAFIEAVYKLRKSIHVNQLIKTDTRFMHEGINWKAFEDELEIMFNNILSKVITDSFKLIKNDFNITYRDLIKKTNTKDYLVDIDFADNSIDEREEKKDYRWLLLLLLFFIRNRVKQITTETKKAIGQLVLAFNKNGQLSYKDSLLLAKTINQCIGLNTTQIVTMLNKIDNMNKQSIPIKRQNEEIEHIRQQMLSDRAKVIAKTETIAAANAGILFFIETLKGTEQEDKFMKQWIVVPDDKLCDFCMEYKDERVKLGETFHGGIDCPPLHPQCRCVPKIIPAKKEGEA